ncbi:MAG TPA: S-methyl-5-thioribose-1-phosphate isomerase [Bacteroidota bacterium]|nr:S-methyl-5-thioribose-1-phosphate isomerase [Bacteroidota bacterium]
MKSIEWMEGSVRFLDQTLLPNEEHYIDTDSIDVIAEAIRRLQVRGAPLIGIAAAYGIALGMKSAVSLSHADFIRKLDEACALITSTRPTAKNLFWAAERMRAIPRLNLQMQGSGLYAALVREAIQIHREDEAMCEAMGRHGAELVPQQAVILTHCNTGALATGGIGTALGVIITAHRQGKHVSVIADETRPLLQGGRLTAWELQHEGIPVTLIPDTATGVSLQEKNCSMVIVGADRIAANGDAANKIGTYGVAVLARYHGVPFYIAAPTSTFDPALESGDSIPIEERSADEVTMCGGVRIAPERVDVFNPAFDVTPHELIAGIITEHGVLRPPYTKSIKALFMGRGIS